MNLDEKKKFIINIVYFTVWAVIVFLIFRVALIYLFPFFVGIFIAYLVQKPSSMISKKLKIKKEICAAVLSVVFFVITILLLLLIIWIIYARVSDFFDYLTNEFVGQGNFFRYLGELSDKIFDYNSKSYGTTTNSLLTDLFSGIVEKTGTFISSLIAGFIKKVPSFFVSSIVTVVATFYISKDFEKIKKFLKGVIKAEYFDNIIDIKNIVFGCIFKFIIGYFWIFLITLTELAIGFFVLGIKNFLMLAIIIAFFDLLPIIGTGTILLPWAGVLFFQDMYAKATGLVLLYFITAFVKNFIEPKIIGKQIEINPLFMLFFIFIGLKLSGIIGMLILPFALTVIFTYYKRKYTD